MSQYSGMEYSDYVLSFMFRRLTYVFDKLRIRKKEDFINNLEDDAFREQVRSLMCVEATEMFRDPSFWRTLRDKLLVDNDIESENIWFPKTSSGEEPFSLSIILHELGLDNKYNIICSCPTKTILTKIENGEINNSNIDLNKTNYKRLEKFDQFASYLDERDGEKVVNSSVLSNIQCVDGAYNLEDKMGDVGFILYRNESLYLNSKKSKIIYNELVDKLKPGGYLAIGVKDNLPKSVQERLRQIDKNERIYQKFKTQKNKEYGF